MRDPYGLTHAVKRRKRDHEPHEREPVDCCLPDLHPRTVPEKPHRIRRDPNGNSLGSGDSVLKGLAHDPAPLLLAPLIESKPYLRV